VRAPGARAKVGKSQKILQTAEVLQAVQGFDILQIPFWTDTPYDVSYRLLGAPVRTGDLNCDGEVDFGDINPFVLALTDPLGWQAAYPDCPVANGDINPFVRLLTQP